MRVLINKHVFLIRVKNWIFYFPSSFRWGHVHVVDWFENWSFYYITLERKLTDKE